MSFTGDLEHLSIVDVIQLLHATRKSGTLVVQGARGESQLVFSDGYIISANHVDNHVRIGNILVEKKVITEDQLHIALLDQNTAGPDRKPLVAMLIEQGIVNRDDAYRCLETLIELTIVEIIGWKRGSFTLEVGNLSLSDEYQYFPEKLHQDIYLHTENVLMDALRIYDERMRDRLAAGEAVEDDDDDIDVGIEPYEGPDSSVTTAAPSLTADDLGLGDLDSLQPKRKERFTGLADHRAQMRHRHHAVASSLPEPLHQELMAFVDAYPASAVKTLIPVSVILYSRDEFLSICLTVVCKQEGLCVLTITEEEDLAAVVLQSLAKKSLPVLVLDAISASSDSDLLRLRKQLTAAFPSLSMLQLSASTDPLTNLQMLKDGIQMLLPRPSLESRPSTFSEEFKRLIQTFPNSVRMFGNDLRQVLPSRLLATVVKLKAAKQPQDVVNAILTFMAELFDRCVALIVRGEELVADRSIGIKEHEEGIISGPLGYIFQPAKNSVLTAVSEQGSFYCGPCTDPAVTQGIFPVITAPRNNTVTLLPLRVNGRTMAVFYGDFGQQETAAVPTELLEVLLHHAGLVLENAFLRSKLKN